jgi:hypothetical protein
MMNTQFLLLCLNRILFTRWMNSKLLLRSILVSLVLIIGATAASHATHLRAGEIIVERVSCNSLTFRITVTVFTNTINTNVLFGGEDDWLDFGDGIRMLVPETQNTARPDLGEGIATASFTVLHTYSGFQGYTVSYSEPNRNEGVVNMDGSVNTRFYIETSIIVDPFLGCNNTPKLLVPPIDRACTGVAWFHNPGAYDPDGDSLSYELVIPFREKETQVINYQDPSAAKFYTNYSTGNEEGTDRPTFVINPTDGTLTWDAPGMSGEYNIAFIIKEWRNIGGRWFNTGFVRRDMQIIVDDCDNERPDLIVPEDVCVEAGTVLDATIFGIDPDRDDVKIEAFSEIFNFAAARSPATYTPNPPVFQSTNPNRAELKFQWKTDCSHVKEQPYQVVFKISDKAANSRLVTFKTWFIKVVGPAPKWVAANVNLANRSANLQWQSYFCQNAEKIQVWRRVDSFAFEPDSCQTGMPDFLGYSLITTLPVKNASNVPVTTYTDTNDGKGLATGAQYCYRLVATFASPRGGESYVSEEICIDPILVDEPVITHVTIDRTSHNDGQVTVRWTKPFEINRTQFPGPFEYEVFRAEGFAGNANLQKVHTGRKSENDTTLVDATGENTRDVIYNYRVVLYSNTSQNLTLYSPVDTSSTASTVRLSAKSEFKKIILDWAAFVPWSNLIQTEPNEHELYRGSAADGEAGLQLIAKIDPTINGFAYVDEGQHNGIPLVDTDEYCYRIMTRGSYGNPGIKEPLENFSQMICAQPNDSIPPCQPELFVQLTDCEEYLKTDATCNLSSFSNTLSWRRPQDECAADIQGYKIYRGATADGEFTWMAEAGENGIVRDTFYVDDGINHAGLGTLAYCYKIAAVDRSNNESELSVAACNDNCPYYELPNVFTPGVGDDCNKFFSAFSNKERYIVRPIADPENPVYYCGGVSDPSKCARFVERVSFKVFNRWGKEIYDYVGARSDDLNSIYIDWDGRAKDGSDLASGIYYYVAEVTFDSSDKDKRNKTIKGWVHLIR